MVAVVLTVAQATLEVDILVEMLQIIQFQHKDMVVVLVGIQATTIVEAAAALALQELMDLRQKQRVVPVVMVKHHLLPGRQ